MLAVIIKKELRESLYTFKFLVFFLLIGVLISLCTVFLVRQHHHKIKAYNLAVQEVNDYYNSIDIYSMLSLKIIKPPNPLALFHQGLEQNFGDIYQVSIGQIPYLEDSEKLAGGNIFSVEVRGFDLATVFTLVLSLMALFWGHHTISGEKERGTLRLVLSNPLPRHQLLWGKVIAGIMTLLIPVITGFMIALLIISLSDVGGPVGDQWLSVGLFALTVILFLLVCYFAAILFSTLTHKASVSLLYAMLFWIFFIIILPNFTPYIINGLYPVPSRQELNRQIAQCNEDFKRQVADIEDSIPQRSFKIDIKANFLPGMDFYQLPTHSIRVETTYRPTLEYMKEFIRQVEPLRLSYMDRIEKLFQRRMGKLKSSLTAYRNISRISPVFLLSDTAALCCGTDLTSYEAFIHALQLYRYQLLNLMKRNDVFESYEYFTAQFSRGKGESKITSHIPRFNFKGLSVIERIQHGLPDLLILIIEAIILFFASITAFLKYDPR